MSNIKFALFTGGFLVGFAIIMPPAVMLFVRYLDWIHAVMSQ